MSQYVISVIRTWVPIIVGSFIGWLATLGIAVDGKAQSALVLAITALITAVYYAALRWLETRFPEVGALLGYIKQPVYVDPKKTPEQQIMKVDTAIAEVAKTPVSGNRSDFDEVDPDTLPEPGKPDWIG